MTCKKTPSSFMLSSDVVWYLLGEYRWRMAATVHALNQLSTAEIGGAWP